MTLRDSGEHALVHGEQEIRDFVATNRWCRQYIPKAYILEVSNIFSGRV